MESLLEKSEMGKRIIILGAGPTGLGAGYRLHELGCNDWEIFEQNDYVGGLSASFKDEEDFTWDLGGHVLFSHFKKFDEMFEGSLGGSYVKHSRKSWIYMLKRWIPYPFQNNLKYLPKDILYECLMGLHQCFVGGSEPKTFRDWIDGSFGKGVAKYFMLPYNRKVWSTDPGKMSHDWISERVSVVDFKQSLRNVIFNEDDNKWGPNSYFKFPLKGGTGEIFRQMSRSFKNRINHGKKVQWIDTAAKTIGFTDESKCTYDILISTIPIDKLIISLKNKPEKIQADSEKLIANKVLVVGLGFSRADNCKKNWVYYPENDNPCYRVTFLSNYSQNNVPDISRSFSLMGELSYPKGSIIKKEDEVEKVIAGYQKVGLIGSEDRHKIKTIFYRELDYAYPVPCLCRDKVLVNLQAYLEKQNIFSRGRFGFWKYEIGNMDHSVMQGVEVVNRLLLGDPEKVINGFA